MFDGDRNAFALLVEPQDYELSGFLLVCNAWRHDDESLDARREKFSVQDFEHVPPWLAPRILSGMRSHVAVTEVTGKEVRINNLHISSVSYKLVE